MFYGDTISEEDRARVFNIYVVPALDESDPVNPDKKKIFQTVTQEKSYILFTYHFSDDVFQYEDTFSLNELQNQFTSADETGPNHYQYFIKQLNISADNHENKLYICIFQYGTHEGFHPSMYSFNKTIIDEWDSSLIMDPPPEKSQYNPWFSNKIIKSMINWDQIKKMSFDEKPKDSIPVIIITTASESPMEFYYINCDSYIKACNKALVPLDMQTLIKEEYQKGNLLIVNVINYLRDYFLLVRIDQENLTFIPSPNDKSLN
jgi:hypothetical protein